MYSDISFVKSYFFQFTVWYQIGSLDWMNENIFDKIRGAIQQKEKLVNVSIPLSEKCDS